MATDSGLQALLNKSMLARERRKRKEFITANDLPYMNSSIRRYVVASSFGI